MPAVGLDISDQSVKFLSLSARADGGRLERYGEREIPAGIIEAGKVKDGAGLERVLTTIRREEKIEYVFASLPEEEAYIVRLTMPAMAINELRGSLELQLEEHVPIPATQAIFDYEILAKPQDKHGVYELVVSVLPESTVSSYSNAFFNAGLELLALEIEAQAIARAVAPTGAGSGTSLVVDFGKTRTSFLVVSGGTVFLSSTVNNIGGEDITKAIQKNLQIDYAAAEKLKINKGLLYARRNKDLFFSVIPVVSILKDEINKQYNYWNSQPGQTPERKITEVIICGGQATLPGLTDYLTLELDLPVSVGDVWRNTGFGQSVGWLPPIVFNQSLRYATAIGLALRNFSHD